MTPEPERAQEDPSARARALALLRRHGRATTSFQTLGPEFEYFFDGDDAFVGYKDTGAAWVAAGDPVASAERTGEVVAHFVQRARARGRRAVFFCVTPELVDGDALTGLPIGEDPVWSPGAWPETLAGARRLREQLRRARAKGVRTRIVDSEALGQGQPLRARVDAIAADWLGTRRMAPMGFLVHLDPFANPNERVFVVAERGNEPVALLVAVPIYARNGFLVEHVLRARDAPNGTTEALLDHLMRELASRGCDSVSLGLAPLAGPLPAPLRWARRLGRPFYNFAGVRAFKDRLRPDRWEPRYLARPAGRGIVRAVLDTLIAFTPRGLVAFSLETIRHRRRLAVRLLWILMLPWILALILSGPRWWPSPAVQWSWIVFDLVLLALMAELTRHWQRWIARVLLVCTSVDVALTVLQAAAFNIPAAEGPLDWLVIAVGLSGPTLATGLFVLVSRPPPPPGPGVSSPRPPDRIL